MLSFTNRISAVVFDETNAADGRAGHEAGELIEILLTETAADNREIDFFDA